jgi:hypothetical protein
MARGLPAALSALVPMHKAKTGSPRAEVRSAVGNKSPENVARTLKLDKELGFLVRQLDTRFKTLYEQLTAQSDITPRQFGVLLTPAGHAHAGKAGDFDSPMRRFESSRPSRTSAFEIRHFSFVLFLFLNSLICLILDGSGGRIGRGPVLRSVPPRRARSCRHLGRPPM